MESRANSNYVQSENAAGHRRTLQDGKGEEGQKRIATSSVRQGKKSLEGSHSNGRTSIYRASEGTREEREGEIFPWRTILFLR